jgi:hypothetical protein
MVSIITYTAQFHSIRFHPRTQVHYIRCNTLPLEDPRPDIPFNCSIIHRHLSSPSVLGWSFNSSHWPLTELLAIIAFYGSKYFVPFNT